MLTPYPTEFPVESVRVVVDALRGNPDVPELVHHGWHAAGYGLGQIVPHGGGLALATAPLTEAEAADVLERALPADGEPTVAQAVPIPWSVIVPLILELIRRRLSR